ncbi:Major Facilitator Superfamily (MFS) [Achlya hypogyna]|uniref:Major Facilitator Superfamily (MFS) n=1 Tax=Achlya hypogyna TaxID=1202772 RepID=A0A1V9Z5A8_ACHHY|nr:Major Facilitator Superfamily (MFS) [Achlya hypogyna]
MVPPTAAVLAGAVLAQFGCGSVSGIVSVLSDLDVLFYSNPIDGRALRVYYAAMAAFGVAAAATGATFGRYSTRHVCWAGAIAVVAGYALAASGVHNAAPLRTAVGFGLHGLGLGTCYLVSLANALQWCPDHRVGLVGGLLATAFGLGAIASSKALPPAAAQWGFAQSFLVVGAVVGTALGISGACLAMPPPPDVVEALVVDELSPKVAEFHPSSPRPMAGGQDDQVVDRSVRWALRTPELPFVCVALAGLVVFGVTLLPRYSLLFVAIFQQTPTAAARTVLTFGLFNVLGRLLGGAASDAVGRCGRPLVGSKALFAALLLFAVAVLSAVERAIDASNFSRFRALVAAYNVAMGAGFGALPALVWRLFGREAFATSFGLVATGWAAAVVGGGAAFGAQFDRLLYTKHEPLAQIYSASLRWLVPLTIVGLVAVLLVRTNAEDRFSRAYTYQWSCGGRPVVKLGRKAPIVVELAPGPSEV